MNNPLVSIVVCTRNRAELIGITIETVLQQRYRPVEVLVVDDGSTDSTEAVVASFGGLIRYVRQEGTGIAAARTAGCRLALGEYIAFQDDDDLMTPGRIEDLMVPLLRHPGAAFAAGDWSVIDASGRETGRRSRFRVSSSDGAEVLLQDGYRAVLWPTLTPLPHTTLFRTADAARIGWFDSGRFFHGCSDTDFFARMGRLGPVVYVPKVVSLYRMGHNQIWANRLLGAYSRLLLLEKHLLSEENRDKELRRRLRSRLLGVLREMASLSRNGALPVRIPPDYAKRGLSLLGPAQRLSYRLHAGVRLGILQRLAGVTGIEGGRS